MYLVQPTKFALLLVLTVIAGTQVLASEIYSWVDESGVSHYSQYPPDRDTPNVSRQKMPNTGPSDGGRTEDVYNVEAHQKKMSAWREKRDQQRQEARAQKRRAADQRAQRYPQPRSYGSSSYWNRPFYRPPIRPPIRPPHRPPNRPPGNSERPIFNPRPPTTSLSGGGSH